ncbi:UNVERIFIED_CONTAM: hypothetical protein K2H54_055835 [Gekko kuhli]
MMGTGEDDTGATTVTSAKVPSKIGSPIDAGGSSRMTSGTQTPMPLYAVTEVPTFYTPSGLSQKGIEVPVEGSTGAGEEEDDPWMRRLNTLERGHLYLQCHLEDALRAIPEMVIRALAAE